MDDLQARVFLSCGQASEEERETARELARILREEFGYKVYVATEQVTFEGVKEAIFPQLTEAEYLLFVDLPRNELADGSWRGSVFSYQELAVAAYLGTPYIGFRHRSVRREGLSQFMLTNVPEFENAIDLPGLLRTELANRDDWDPHWRKRLVLCRRDPDEHDDMFTTRVVDGKFQNAPVRFFHLTVQNQHRDKMAVGCTAYVETIRDLESGDEIAFRPAEIKWAGTTLPSVPLPAGRTRDLDACRIWVDRPDSIDFVSLSDSGHHMAPIADRAVDVVYVVLSENFPPARRTIRIEPGRTAQEARVTEISTA